MKHVTMWLWAVSTLAAALLGVSVVQAEEDTTGGAKIGTLTCTTVPGTHKTLLIRSSVDLDCVYQSGKIEEKYKGETGIALGVDLNIKQDETLVWRVLAPSANVEPGNYALAGKYKGAKASATVGVGVGANVLIGGSKESFTLQPVSLAGSTGVGVAGGLGYLYLEAAK